jgi:hypothetical protein
VLWFLVGWVLLTFFVFCVVIFGWLSVAHLFIFLCCYYCFVCLRLVSCAPNALLNGGCISTIIFMWFYHNYLVRQLYSCCHSTHLHLGGDHSYFEELVSLPTSFFLRFDVVICCGLVLVLCFVCPLLSVSEDYPFLIATTGEHRCSRMVGSKTVKVHQETCCLKWPRIQPIIAIINDAQLTINNNQLINISLMNNFKLNCPQYLDKYPSPLTVWVRIMLLAVSCICGENRITH